jgi:hypothetical protein
MIWCRHVSESCAVVSGSGPRSHPGGSPVGRSRSSYQTASTNSSRNSRDEMFGGLPVAADSDGEADVRRVLALVFVLRVVVGSGGGNGHPLRCEPSSVAAEPVDEDRARRLIGACALR